MRDQTTWAVTGIVSGLGVVLSGLHLWHGLEEITKGLLPVLYGVVLPLVVSLLITGGGYWIGHRDWSAVSPWRIAWWCGAGLIVGIATSGLLIQYQTVEGVRITDSWFVLGMFGTYGAAGGLLVGWYDVQMHVQQRRQAHQSRELERTNTVLRTIIENLPMGVLVENAERTILMANDRLEETLGVPLDSDDLVGRDCDAAATELEDLFADPDAFVRGIDDRIAEREQEHEELVLADGRTLERYYVPYTLPDGAAQLWLYRDITDRKQREQTLERQNERLEQFASTISHDLRNPLNVATTRLELAQAECDSEHLDAVADAHVRMETLIEDILTLAREGERVDETEPVELADTTATCWRYVETAEGTLVTETEQTIRADPSRLQELLENLFRNAVEHAGDDVTVTIGELDTKTGFYVADDGPGIPADEREQVFDAGYSTADDGTGLGLNIVQQIATAHGWDITVTESDTGGARFEISGVEVIDT